LITITSSGPEQTRALGRATGEQCRGRLAVLLSGDYGSGKTTFVQGLALGLGVADTVRSPSYNIVRRYEGSRLVLLHADLYRATSLAEVDELGLEELAGTESVIAVEWPGDYTIAFSDRPQLSLHFAHVLGDARDEDSLRNISIDWSADCPADIVEALRAFAA
jgi:tRNA threonylcarbamoyladenosine biosynthesis protein TsaE